jgi:hypothetical protein
MKNFMIIQINVMSLLQHFLTKVKSLDVTALDMNMGYYHIRLTFIASAICTVI